MKRTAFFCRASLLCVALLLTFVEASGSGRSYWALKSVLSVQRQRAATWARLDRDGAHRKVRPYLSSLGAGEVGTGLIRSPVFTVKGKTISFAFCGHDGRGGGRKRNFIALVDAETGKVLRKAYAPGSDAMQERTWRIGDLKGKRVRIIVCDGLAEPAWAWLGVGWIKGSGLSVDFARGIPKGWEQSPLDIPKKKNKLLKGGMPFLLAPAYTIFPKHGKADFLCGFKAKRLFFLGMVVSDGKPLEVYGVIEIRYRSGGSERIPLVYGFTLEGEAKLPSPSAARYVRPSADPFLYYLVVKTRNEEIESIRFEKDPGHGPVPRITAVTVETDQAGRNLLPLPHYEPPAEEKRWIEERAVSGTSPNRAAVMEILRRHCKLPPLRWDWYAAFEKGKTIGPAPVGFKKVVIDTAFRSEGVAVADFNRDGHLDIAAGTVYYAGPKWRPVPMLGKAPDFPRKGYSDAFLCFADDLNHDGWTDLITVGFPGAETTWLENPGPKGGVWRRYKAIEHTGNESPWYGDIDRDGRKELIFVAGDRLAAARPGADCRALWEVIPIGRKGEPLAGHGLGVGDLNGDGRLDVLLPTGWWEQPAGGIGEPWPFHSAAFAGGAQLCVLEVDGDGNAEVLGSSPHGYGVWWTRREEDAWRTYLIDNEISQTHAVCIADIDGNGTPDFVTGKRYWAHNGHDIGSAEPAFLCWFSLKRGAPRPSWTKYTIDDHSGVGLQVLACDIDRDGDQDIVVSNKLGVFLFANQLK